MIDALHQAHYAFTHRDTMDRQARVDAAVELGEWGVWSNRHVATLTGLRPAFVNELTGKRDKSGGNMNPERLGDVIEVAEARARGEEVKDRVVALLGEGFSSGMLARLTGVPQSTIARWGAA